LAQGGLSRAMAMWQVAADAALAVLARLVHVVCLVLKPLFARAPAKGLGAGKTVLVTTGRQVKTLHIVRALKDIGCRVVVTDYQAISASRVSASCDAFHQLQPLDAEHLDHWVEHLAHILALEKVDVVLPVATINEALFIATAKDRLQRRFPTVKWFQDGLAMTMKLDHKAQFAEMCDRVGVPVPEHGVITCREEASALPPLDRIFKRLESTVNRETEIKAVPRGAPLPTAESGFAPSAADPWQHQRLLTGTEYSAWYVCYEGKVTFAACYPSQADLLHFEGLPVPEDVNACFEKFIAANTLSGNFAFDYFREADGSFYVIECNPRASSVLEGVSCTPRWGECFFGVDVRERTTFQKVGFWFHKNCFPFPGSWSSSEGWFSAKDPLPFVVGEVAWPLELLRRGLNGFHHIDVNIGKIIAGSGPARNFDVFQRLIDADSSGSTSASDPPTPRKARRSRRAKAEAQ